MTKGATHGDLMKKLLLKYTPPIHHEFYLQLSFNGADDDILVDLDMFEENEVDEAVDD